MSEQEVTTTNEHGGKQSEIEVDLTYLDDTDIAIIFEMATISRHDSEERGEVPTEIPPPAEIPDGTFNSIPPEMTLWFMQNHIPMDGFLQIAAVLKAGAEKYGPGNWRKIGRRSQLSHALLHMVKTIWPKFSTDTDDNEHAATRAMFSCSKLIGD